MTPLEWTMLALAIPLTSLLAAWLCNEKVGRLLKSAQEAIDAGYNALAESYLAEIKQWSRYRGWCCPPLEWTINRIERGRATEGDT